MPVYTEPDKTITVGETADWTLNVTRDAVARNLSGATIVLNLVEEIAGTTKISDGSCSIADAAAGTVTYSPNAGDVDTDGDYVVQLKVTIGGKDEYYPNSGAEKYRIRMDLAIV